MPAEAQKKKRSANTVAAPTTISNPRFEPVDAILKAAVAEKNPPGAVVLVGHNGKIVYRKAFGYRSLEPCSESMTIDTIFDMASLTKCLATATSITRMLELGQIRLNDPVSKYLPDFAQNGKKDITIRQLVTHYSGLAPDLDLKQPWTGYDTAITDGDGGAVARSAGLAVSFIATLITSCSANWFDKITGMPLEPVRGCAHLRAAQDDAYDV